MKLPWPLSLLIKFRRAGCYPEPPPWPTCCGKPMDACHPEQIMRCSVCGAFETNSYYLPSPIRDADPNGLRRVPAVRCGRLHGTAANAFSSCYAPCTRDAGHTGPCAHPLREEDEITDGDRALLAALQADVLPTEAIDAASAVLDEYRREARVWTAAELDAQVAPAAPRLDPSVMETWTDEDERDLADTVAGCEPPPAEQAEAEDDAPEPEASEEDCE